MQDNFGSFQKMGIFVWNTSINCVLILLTSLFPADFASIGMPCCCHGNGRSLYGLRRNWEKIYAEMGQQLEQRTLNVSVPPVNKWSMEKKERSQIITNDTEQNLIG